MEKSSEYIDLKAYIRYLRKVTGEQLNTDAVRRSVIDEIFRKSKVFP